MTTFFRYESPKRKIFVNPSCTKHPLDDLNKNDIFIFTLLHVTFPSYSVVQIGTRVKVLCYLEGEKIWVVVLHKTTITLDCGQSKYSQQIHNLNIYQIWAWLLRFLSYVISKSSNFLLYKNFELTFAALYFIFMS